jgi:hypothetical protein
VEVDNLKVYSYLMGVDAIDQTICPSVQMTTKMAKRFASMEDEELDNILNNRDSSISFSTIYDIEFRGPSWS